MPNRPLGGNTGRKSEEFNPHGVLKQSISLSYQTEAYWVPPNPLTVGDWIFYPLMLGGWMFGPWSSACRGLFFFQFWHISHQSVLLAFNCGWKALWFTSYPILFVYLQSGMFGLACSIDIVHIQQNNRILKWMSMTESCLSSLCQWALLWEGDWTKAHIWIIWTELEPGYGYCVIMLKAKKLYNNCFVSPLLTFHFQQA